MASDDKKQMKKAIDAFARKLAQSHVHDVEIGESVKLKLTVPELSSLGTNFHRQLLSAAQLHLAPQKNMSVTLSRSGNGVSITLVRRF